MKKLLTIFLLSSTLSAIAQEREMYSTAQKTKLSSLATELSTKHEENYQKALVLAKQKGWKTEGRLSESRFFRLQGVDDTGQPLYLVTESNAQASATTRTNQLYTGGSLGLSLSGSSDEVKDKLGIWDGGAVLATHNEFSGRVAQQDNITTTDMHATHVAGTLIAGGVDAQARGMSFGANLKAWDFNNDVTEMTKAASGLLVSNHSYGFQAGWVYDDTRSRWSWYGNTKISATEDYKFGFYDTNTQAWDKIAYSAPYYLIVKSAGNNRGSTGPASGTYYFLGTSSDSSNVARSKNDSYDVISTTGTAKNILSVGAIEGTKGNAPAQASEIKMSSFSSWGPTDDGRIKPDIVAVGVNLFSTSNTSNSAYTILSGTSMSSPQAAGSILLLQELYSKQNDKQLMKASTLKGLILHTADDAGNTGPDYVYGWGLLNMEKAAKVILNTDKSYSLAERSLKTGESFTQKVIASGKGAMRATICWTDPEGTASLTTVDNLNNRTPKLINDLDIKITDEANNYLPFILNPEQPSAVATTGDNIRDNVEQILILDAVPGKTYTLTVSHKGTLKNSVQDYALIMSGIGGKEYCASVPATVKSNIESIKIGGLTEGFKVYSSQKVNVELSLKGTTAKTSKIYVDWNMDSSFDEATELVATSNDLSGVFNTTFSAPSGLEIGNSTLMRVVSVENATTVSGCGNYSNGITKDYRIQFVRPEIDLTVLNLVTPDVSNLCNGVISSISISLKNIGSATQTDIPVSVNVSDKTGVLATFKGQYTKSLSILTEGTVQLQGSVSVVSGNIYTFEVKIENPNDQDLTNNSKTFTRQVSLTEAPFTAQAVICEGATALSLKANELSAVLWYDSPNGGNLLFTGNSGSITKALTTSKVYAGLNDFSSSFGVKDKYALGGGTYYDIFGPEPVFEVKSPLILESAKIYVGTSGKITFSITRVSDLTPISSVTVTVNATRTSANATRTGSQLIDDLTDPGVVVPLNLAIPAAGTYKLTQECTDGASIYRSNLNVGATASGKDIVGYPFSISNIINMTGALFNGSLIKTGYYYTYDMKVKLLGCPSDRIEVPIITKASPKAVVTPADKISFCQGDTKDIIANAGTNYTYQWFKDGIALTGSTAATYKVESAGSYNVVVTENNLCTAASPLVKATALTPVVPAITWNGGALSINTGNNPIWYVDGNIIANTIGNSVVPLKSGYYTVKSTDANGCTSFSAGYSIVITAIEDEITGSSAQIFPNPTQGKFKVEYRSAEMPKQVQAEIVNIFGMSLMSKALSRQSNIYAAEFDMTNNATGKYFVRITTDKFVQVIPLIITGN